MKLTGGAARNAMAWEMVKLYGADGARERTCGPMRQAVEAEIAAMYPAKNCQNGRSDVCLAGFHDGVCCPDDSCDIDDGLRDKVPNASRDGA